MKIDKVCCICSRVLLSTDSFDVYSYLDSTDMTKSFCKFICEECSSDPSNKEIKSSLTILSQLSRVTKSTVSIYRQQFSDYLSKKEIGKVDKYEEKVT